MSSVTQTIEYAREHGGESIEQLRTFCSIPSISTLPEHREDVQRAAEWLAERLRGLGMPDVSILSTSGYPVVFAQGPRVPSKPTVLVYGHYDVQPVDPVHDWNSPPFEPQTRNDHLYARGSSDMKGQIVAVLSALEALVHTRGSVPVNLKFLFEGEEEIGSPSLGSFVDAHRERLQCDVVLNCDGGIHAADVPSITYGLRGLAYFELEVRGPRNDLHSGVFGGAVHNPAHVLCRLVAGMHDAAGRITLPGFYDSVRPLTDDERAELARVPMSEEDWLRITGAPASWGENDFTILERIGARPSLDVNGLISGFTGEGSKTVLPARAMAKLSMRLTPDQRGEEVARQLRAYVAANAPPTVTWEVRDLNFAAPALIERRSPYILAAAQALESVFGKPPLYKRDGGTIPVVGILKEKLGVDSVLLGFELPDAGFHGPNEKMHLPTFHRGIETYIRFLTSL